MKRTKYTLCAFLAAALYALNAPISKLLLSDSEPKMTAALLYLGAGLGMGILLCVRRALGIKDTEKRLGRRDLPYTVGMVLLDIAAPIFLMLGLLGTNAGTVSLLNNFEIVATSLIALLLFGEKISKRLWLAIGLVTLSSIVLSVEDFSELSFSTSSLFVILACICWGLENNCTRSISDKNPLVIVVIKGLFSGLGAFAIALLSGESIPGIATILATLALGFAAYGLSITFYIYAQRGLGAARTGAYYAIAPFVGALLSFVMLGESLSLSFAAGLVIMIFGAYLSVTDSKL